MKYPIRVQALQFKDEGHRLKTDALSGASRSLRAGKDAHQREVIIEMDEVCTHVYRERMADGKVHVGEFEHLHTIPNAQIKQADAPDGTLVMPVTYEPPKAAAVNVLDRAKR